MPPQRRVFDARPRASADSPRVCPLFPREMPPPTRRISISTRPARARQSSRHPTRSGRPLVRASLALVGPESPRAQTLTLPVEPSTVGEFSLGTQTYCVAYADCVNVSMETNIQDSLEQSVFINHLWEAQRAVYEQSAGWLFWSWKTDAAPTWSFRQSARQGWIPEGLTNDLCVSRLPASSAFDPALTPPSRSSPQLLLQLERHRVLLAPQGLVRRAHLQHFLRRHVGLARQRDHHRRRH